jgi:carboxypeptidase Taq
MKPQNPVINQILDAYKPIWSINHATSLMGWDFETYMPRKGTEERGVADSQLRLLYKELLLNKDLLTWLNRGRNRRSALTMRRRA